MQSVRRRATRENSSFPESCEHYNDGGTNTVCFDKTHMLQLHASTWANNKSIATIPKLIATVGKEHHG